MKRFLFLFAAICSVVAITSCNKCKKVECLNSGTCEDGTCICLNGFSGDSCQIEDLCITNNVNCKNDGVCLDGECDCERKYYGEECETHCVNGRYVKSSGLCDCYSGYSGDACETEMRLDWIAEYKVSSDCSQDITPGIITAMDHPDDQDSTLLTNYVSVTNLTANGDTKGYGIIVEGNKLVIPKQNVKDKNGTKFSVETFADQPATLSGGNFNILIKRIYDGNATLCTHTYTRD